MRYAAPPAVNRSPDEATGTDAAAPVRFTVLVAVYQGADYVLGAVRSALEQVPAPYELLVCDDGSTDDLLGALAPVIDRVTVLHLPHGGVAAARQAGLLAATGDVVVTLDADDEWLPGRLAAMEQIYQERPDIDIVTSDAMVVDGDADDREVGTFTDSICPFEPDDQRVQIIGHNFLFSHVAVRRARMLEVGGYDVTLLACSDWDLWMRLILSGSSVACIEEPLAIYRIHENSITSNRIRCLRAEVDVLRNAATEPSLDAHERTLIAGGIEAHRREVALAEAELALVKGEPGARRAFLAFAVDPNEAAKTRAKAAVAAASPRLAGALARRMTVRNGYSRLSRLRRVPGE